MFAFIKVFDYYVVLEDGVLMIFFNIYSCNVCNQDNISLSMNLLAYQHRKYSPNEVKDITAKRTKTYPLFVSEIMLSMQWTLCFSMFVVIYILKRMHYKIIKCVVSCSETSKVILYKSKSPLPFKNYFLPTFNKILQWYKEKNRMKARHL